MNNIFLTKCCGALALKCDRKFGRSFGFNSSKCFYYMLKGRLAENQFFKRMVWLHFIKQSKFSNLFKFYDINA